MQLAPVFSFLKISDQDGQQTFLNGGNFFDVIPYEGRYDAQPLNAFRTDKNNRVTVINQSGLLALKGQFRDLKWLRMANQKENNRRSKKQ